jgi:hypothetical protein
MNPAEEKKPEPTSTPRERINGYRCTKPKCGHITLTVDVDEGVTPFMIGCTKCKADAHSMFYPQKGLPPPMSAVTHEWFKPDDAALKRLDPGTRQHVQMGGLIMRPRTNRPPRFHR